MSAPLGPGLSDGTRIRLLPSVRRFAAGRVLHGGSPTRLLRLRPEAVEMLGPAGDFTVDGPRSNAFAATLLRSGFAEITGTDERTDLDRVTVVVPVHDTPEALERLLSALTGVRVVVVDDASPDPAAIARVTDAHGARLLRLPRNLGPAAARNAGLRCATTPFVAFCDADTVVTPDALRRLLTHFADARTAVAAPRVLGLPAPNPNWIARYENARSSLDLGPESAVVQPHSRVGWLPSACLLARRTALGTGFDPTLRVGEDVDLVWRLCADGWLIRYDADTTVRHEHRRDPRQWLARKHHYGTSAAPLATRHGDRVAPAVLTWDAAFLAAGLLAHHRITLLAALAAFLARTTRTHRQLRVVDNPPGLTTDLTVRATADAVRQASALLLRHWWPATLLAATASHRVRRAAALALAVDLITTCRAHGPNAFRPGFVLARRLDDMAYGLGVWHGALRARSPKCLLPHVLARPHPPTGTRRGRRVEERPNESGPVRRSEART
ncbi:mycofactocin biosynthesis glycosyltransferase MftF [Nocardia sp. NPDC003482]